MSLSVSVSIAEGVSLKGSTCIWSIAKTANVCKCKWRKCFSVCHITLLGIHQVLSLLCVWFHSQTPMCALHYTSVQPRVGMRRLCQHYPATHILESGYLQAVMHTLSLLAQYTCTCAVYHWQWTCLFLLASFNLVIKCYEKKVAKPSNMTFLELSVVVIKAIVMAHPVEPNCQVCTTTTKIQ